MAFVSSLVTSIQLPVANARSLATSKAPGLLGEANTTIRLQKVSLCRGSSPGTKRCSLSRLPARGPPSSNCSVISLIDIVWNCGRVADAELVAQEVRLG